MGAAEIFTLFNFQSKKFHHRAFRSNLFCPRRKNIHAQKRISTTIAAPNSPPFTSLLCLNRNVFFISSCYYELTL